MFAKFLPLVLAQIVLGQGQSTPEFEVVSVRPHPVGPIFMSSNMIRGSTYRGVAITLMDIVTDAYGLQRNQVSGGPAWITSDRFDVEAKAGGDAELPLERARPMLQSMLAERFKLKVRREMREVPAYDLVTGKNGPKFKPSPQPDSQAPGFLTRFDTSGVHVVAAKGSMGRLAVQLALNSGRPVADKTGLTGEYEFQLDFAPDNSPAAVDGSAPTLFTAIEDQLGLKLQPSRMTQEMLVIESAEKPSAN